MIIQTTRIHVDGMTCGGCVNSIESALVSTAGVTQVTVSLESAQAEVSYEDSQTSPKQIMDAIEEAGFDARLA